MKKKSLEEYKETNEILKLLNEERIKRKKDPKTESPEQKSDLHFSDGRSIYLTPLDFISPPAANTITLRQLLYEDLQDIPNRAKTIKSCIMTTFCIENSFISPIISQNFPFCLVVQSKSASLTRVNPFFTVISPEIKDRYGSFHAKVFLIKFDSRLRVVVTSANLIKADWSLIGQCVWFQDFYRSGPCDSTFKSSLKAFFQEVLPSRYSLKEDLDIDLDVFDFSTSSVELVFSIPGRFPVTRGLGLTRIRDLTQGKRFNQVLYQCSSIGSFNQKSFANFLKTVAGNEQAEAKIVFPSIRNVRESTLGPDGAGVFFVKREHFEAKGFPKEKFCRFEGPEAVEQLRGHLSHSKVMILKNDGEASDDDLVYLGSHNLSAAAWGVLEKDASQIYIKNFEIGVVFVPKEGSASLKQRLISQLPFKFPPSRYEQSDRPFYIDSDLSE